MQKRLVEDVKGVPRVVFMQFLMLPIFWSLYDQQVHIPHCTMSSDNVSGLALAHPNVIHELQNRLLDDASGYHSGAFS